MVVLPVPPLPARAIVYGIFKVFLSIYEGSKVWGFALRATTPQAGFRVNAFGIWDCGFVIFKRINF
jgi:hypothetical protein